MVKNKNNGTSMFLYTALIFVVAILLILLSFFGQARLQKSQPVVQETTVPSEQPGNSITQKAAVLSEENRLLLEENQKQKEEMELLNEEVSKRDEIIKNYEILLSAYGYLSVGNKEMAKEQLDKLNPEMITGDREILYNRIINQVQ